jgi:peptidoglycan/xylan/chitin deacetylase (PgdA/CDA1 family)
MSSNDPLILLYHGVDSGDGRYANTPSNVLAYTVTQRQFGDHLKMIADSGRNVVDPSIYFKSPHNTRLNPNDVILTFDDGERSDYDIVFPMLVEAGYPAIFFICTDMVEKPGKVSWKQLAEMAETGMIIASHSHSHQPFTSLRSGMMAVELDTSCRLLSEHVSKVPHVLSLPHGMYNKNVLQTMVSHGFNLAFTSEPEPPRELGGVRLLGRVAVNRTWTRERMQALLKDTETERKRLETAYQMRGLLKSIVGWQLYAALHRFVWGFRGGKNPE